MSYDPGSVIGDWTVSGNVNIYIINKLSTNFEFDNYPYGLQYSCFLEVKPYPFYNYEITSSIQKTFPYTIIGDCYHLSFWYAFRKGYYEIPSRLGTAIRDFKVILDGHIIYTTIPEPYVSDFVQVITGSIKAASTSINLTISITQSSALKLSYYQNIGINAVSLLHYC
jgi:hypothetical protein